jgi:hypothetical protein
MVFVWNLQAAFSNDFFFKFEKFILTFLVRNLPNLKKKSLENAA